MGEKKTRQDKKKRANVVIFFFSLLFTRDEEEGKKKRGKKRCLPARFQSQEIGRETRGAAEMDGRSFAIRKCNEKLSSITDRYPLYVTLLSCCCCFFFVLFRLFVEGWVFTSKWICSWCLVYLRTVWLAEVVGRFGCDRTSVAVVVCSDVPSEPDRL